MAAVFVAVFKNRVYGKREIRVYVFLKNWYVEENNAK